MIPLLDPIVLSIIVLVLVFAIASIWDVNIGTLAFPASFLVATYAGISIDKLYQGFPVDLFLVVVGITYLFAIANANGTVSWILDGSLRLLRGRVVLLPVMVFALAFVISLVGTVGTVTLAMTLPVAMGFAYRYGLNPFLMAISTVCGAQAGYFSPIAIYNVTVSNIVQGANLPLNAGLLFVNHLLINLVLFAFAFLAFGGRKLISRRELTVASAPSGDPIGRTTDSQSVSPTTSSSQQSIIAVEERSSEPTVKETPSRVRAYQVATIFGLIALITAILIFHLDPGLTSLTIALVLMLVFARKEDKTYVGKVTWPVVLMLTGILTYVGVLESVGTIDAVSHALTGIGNPKLGILSVSYLSGITSAFASSIGTMGVTVPLALPILHHASNLSILGSVSSITASTYLVDMSPLSILGALVLANARESDRASLFRKCVAWAVAMVLLAPLLTWLAFVTW